MKSSKEKRKGKIPIIKSELQSPLANTYLSNVYWKDNMKCLLVMLLMEQASIIHTPKAKWLNRLGPLLSSEHFLQRAGARSRHKRSQLLRLINWHFLQEWHKGKHVRIKGHEVVWTVWEFQSNETVPDRLHIVIQQLQWQSHTSLSHSHSDI